MNSTFAVLLRKELRLQRNNLVFAAAFAVLGFIGLLLVANASTQTLAGYDPMDVQSGIVMAGLLPVVGLICLMIGSTAAAAERPTHVLAWQDALPVSRWKILLTKALVMGLASALAGGLIPVFLATATLDPGLISTFYRNLWPGWVGLLLTALGFFSGSFAKDDYQGLLLAMIPLGVLALGVYLSDPFHSILPMVMPQDLQHPWSVRVRLVVLAGMFLLLASKRLGRIQTRRWSAMAASLLIVFAAGLLLTRWNMLIELRTLQFSDKVIHTDDELMKAHPNIKVPQTREIAQFSAFPDLITDVILAGGRTVIVGCQFLIGSDGRPRQFPITQRSQETYASGFSKNENWVVLNELDQPRFMLHKSGFGIDLNLLPSALGRSLMHELQFSYPLRAWTLLRPTTSLTNDDKQLPTFLKNSVWKDAEKQIPPGATVALLKSQDDGTLMVSVRYDGGTPNYEAWTSMTAILRPDKNPGEFRLAGFVNGEPVSVSGDAQWARIDTLKGVVYRPVLPWQQAIAMPAPVAPERYTGRSLFSSEVQDDGTTVASMLPYFSLPLVYTSSGPATVRAYITIDSVEQTTVTTPGVPYYITTAHCRDVGVELFDLQTSKTTRFSMLLPGETGFDLQRESQTAGPLYMVARTTPSWVEHAQTLVMQANGITRFADFSAFDGSTSPTIVYTRESALGAFLGPGRYASINDKSLRLSTW